MPINIQQDWSAGTVIAVGPGLAVTTGTIDVTGSFAGNVHIYGSLQVDGSTTLSSTLNVTGAATFATSIATPLITTNNTALSVLPPAVAGVGVTGYAVSVSGGNAGSAGTGGTLTLRGGSATSGITPSGAVLTLNGHGTDTATLVTGSGGSASFSVTASTLALTGALTVSSTAAITGAATLSSTLNVTGAATFTSIRSSGTIAQTGTTTVNTNAFSFWTSTFTGSLGASQGYGPLYIAPNETVNYYGAGAWSIAYFTNSLGGAGSAGTRNGVFAQLTRTAASDPGDPSDRADVGVHGRATSSVSNGGKQMGSSTDGSATLGSVFGGNVQASLTGTALYFDSVNGFEIDKAIAAGASAKAAVGLNIVQNSNDVNRGSLSDVALHFGLQASGAGPGWKTGISFGRETGDPATASDTTLFKATQRRYGGGNTVPFQYGVDLREGSITSGGYAWASLNAAIDDVGALYGNAVTTNGTVRAQTATLTAVNIAQAGEYLLSSGQKPTFTIAAPPSGGTQAAFTTNAMVGVGIRLKGSTGKNYLVNDVLTLPTATGTPPTITVTAVDANGGITAATLTTNGAYTKAPANPVYPTGGSGTGAAFNVAYTGSTNTFVPSALFPAATGAGHAAADVLTIVGDTGTAVKFNVATVDSFGGILTVTLNTAGSVTAIAGSSLGSGLIAAANYHTATTTGAGTGGQFGVTYAPNTFTITNAGAGYLPKPLPVIIPNLQSTWLSAELYATMTSAAAALNLNPTSGNVSMGNSGGQVGFYGSAGAAKPTVTGSRGGNAALASLLTALASLGILTDSTTA